MEIVGYNNITVDNVGLITYQKLKDPQNSQDILKSIYTYKEINVMYSEKLKPGQKSFAFNHILLIAI